MSVTTHKAAKPVAGSVKTAGVPVLGETNPLTGGIVWTAAEFAAITPEAGKFYLVEA